MKNQNNDRLLFFEVAKGNEAAFKKLFEDWYGFLASHIFRITKSREITEEIVLDVFLKIWQTRETLEHIENFKAYLIVVSRNHALNVLRKLAVDSQNHQHWLSEMRNREHPDPGSGYYSLIDEAIDQLSPRQREVYLLHRHHRMTYKEIAVRLKLSRETIKTHLQSAIASISRYVVEKMKAFTCILFFSFFL